jgi:1-deoxy-D-xylulose-5-phosphate synthase
MDGYDIAKLGEILDFCKSSKVPSLIHMKTGKGQREKRKEKREKGKGNGYVDAIYFPAKFHGVESERAYNEFFILQSDAISYGEIVSKELTKRGQKDKIIIGFVSAMARGTGLSYLRDHCLDQCISVGIAEEHAVTFSAALANCDMWPVCAIYFTFL